MKKIEFMQFLEAQNLNGLQANHLQLAISALQDMGVPKVPSLTVATRWVCRTVWA